MATFKEWVNMYEELKEKPIYRVVYASTGKIKEYKPVPDTLIGRHPVYEMEYQVVPLSLQKKDDIFSALIGGDSRIFDNKEDAEKMAKILNKEAENYKNDCKTNTEETEEER